MATPYLEDMALESKNNEAISEIISLKETVEVEGVMVTRPVNLTGREFFGQARSAKSIDSDLLCNIEITIHGNPLNGQLHFSVADEVMRDVPAIKGHYDVLTRVTGSPDIDNLYQAPFNVGAGITDPSQWT